MQFGYFAGSIAGGAALTVGGYSALGATMGAFFLGAAAILAHDPAWRRAATEQDRACPRACATGSFPGARVTGNRPRSTRARQNSDTKEHERSDHTSP